MFKPRLNILVVRVCSLLPKTQENNKTKKIAAISAVALEAHRKIINIGISGKVLMKLNFFCPFIVCVLLQVQRTVRALISKHPKSKKT